jgi:pyrroloquinoline-quinone synthase
MSVIDRIDAARARWNILAHPFYVRWERGELTDDELARYAGQYRHAVLALADAAETAGEHAEEERAHVALWDDFAAALDADAQAPLPETERCVAAWTAAADPLEATAILYAIEAGQPEVSKTKLTGLVEHYGFEAESPATAYFAVHAERDHVHAREGRELLERLAAPEDTDRLAGAAEGALAANWALLDGVSAAMR